MCLYKGSLEAEKIEVVNSKHNIINKVVNKFKINQDEINRNKIKNSDENEKRQISAKKVAKYLKITKPTFLNYPGLKMSRNDTTKMAKSIYDEILKFRPDIIFSHCIDDNHHDHRVTAEAVFIATRPSSKTSYLKKIYSMEIPSASDKLLSKKKSFNPNYFIDIKKTYKKK